MAEREAWVSIPDPERRAAMSSAEDPYNFGFVPAMGGLIGAHARIAPRFLALYRELMFSSGSALSRSEREMIAGVAAAAQDCFY
jgi:hypothetical protein